MEADASSARWIIRPTLSTDLEAIIAMATNSFQSVSMQYGLPEPDLGSEEQVSQCIEQVYPNSFVALVAGTHQIIGFNAFEEEGDNVVVVGPFVVSKAFEGKGIGRMLMQEVMTSIRERYDSPTIRLTGM